MQPEHREAIQTNFSTLVEQTDLDLMVAALYEKGVFSDPMIEPYRDTSKDARYRKRLLYLDITRRGPEAFDHLIDALSENGYWALVRLLYPDSIYNPKRPMPSESSERFLSLSDKRKTLSGKGGRPPPAPAPPPPPAPASTADPAPPPPPPEPELLEDIPHFNVIKSTKFVEEEDGEIKLYRTRGRARGVLVVFSYISFSHDIEKQRKGARRDADNLRYLFSELGFKVLSYFDLTLTQTKDTLNWLKLSPCAEGAETVFVVFSSHGHQRHGTSDYDIRCHDGKLISFYEIIKYFNNVNFPALKNIPKVFIFQSCRGSNADSVRPPRHVPAPASLPPATPAHDAPAHDGHPFVGPARQQYHDRDPDNHDRTYSDILIANSTVPGFVSNRDEILGSWYIQALCDVFAAHAHDCHVEDLFTLVDERLREQFVWQTSSVDRWGFNRRLYLHPGMYED